MKYECNFCRTKKQCNKRAEMGNTGCCGYEDYRVIRFFKRLFCRHWYFMCEDGIIRCDKCERVKK